MEQKRRRRGGNPEVMDHKTKMKNIRKRKKIRLFLYIISLAVLVLIIYFLFISKYFAIKEVKINGLDTLSENEINKYIKIEKGKNIFLQNFGKNKRNVLESNNIVESITFKREFPGKVVIDVKEKSSYLVVGSTEGSNSYYLFLSPDGEIIEKSDTSSNIRGPLLSNITFERELEVGEQIVKEEVRDALNFINLLPKDKKKYVKGIEVREGSITFNDGTQNVKLGTVNKNNINKKINAYELLIDNPSVMSSPDQIIDLSMDNYDDVTVTEKVQ